MNKHVNSTAPAETASTVDLDEALHDLANMALIASELANDDLGKSHKEVTGSDNLIVIGPKQRNRLLFAVFQVERMVDRLVDAHNRGALA